MKFVIVFIIHSKRYLYVCYLSIIILVFVIIFIKLTVFILVYVAIVIILKYCPIYLNNKIIPFPITINIMITIKNLISIPDPNPALLLDNFPIITIIVVISHKIT